MTTPDESVSVLRVQVHVEREDQVPPRVMNALEELAAALAAEEFPLEDELADRLRDESEVVGFGFGDGGLRLGDIGGMGGPKSFNAKQMGWCVGYSSGGGGSCTLFGADSGDPTPDSCTVFVW